MNFGSISEYREKSLDKMKEANLPSFKHGLNISINPEGFDFEKLTKINGEDVNKKIPKELLSEEFEQFNHKVDFLCQAKGKYVFLDKTGNYQIKGMSNVFVLAQDDENLEINLKDISEVSLIKVLAKGKSNVKLNVLTESGNRNSFHKVIVLQEENSYVEINKIIFGSDYVRDEIYCVLSEKSAECKQKILFLAKDSEKFDIYTCAIHEAESTKSDLLSRGILRVNSKVVERGMIKISENAANSIGYEKQDALVLDKAEADAIPDLEINNHEVKCSHGTSIGRIDQEAIYYLMSRGLNEQEAKREIIKGYFSEVVDKIDGNKFKDKLLEVLDKNGS